MPEVDRPANPSPWWESIAASLILFSFLFASLLVATRTPTVFMDEVEYTDPAANLYFGKGFTSTMWAQDRHEFWCGNVPLYQGLLFAAFKIFGSLGDASADDQRDFGRGRRDFLSGRRLRRNRLSLRLNTVCLLSDSSCPARSARKLSG